MEAYAHVDSMHYHDRLDDEDNEEEKEEDGGGSNLII
jgi:hypothetical protein